MGTQVNFRCDRETLERRVARITKLAGEARTFMHVGNDCACIAKYHAVDVELGRLANLVDDEDRGRLKDVIAKSSDTNPPGK